MSKACVGTFSCPVTAVPLVVSVPVVDRSGSQFIPTLILFQGGQAILNTIQYQNSLNNAFIDDKGASTATLQTGTAVGSINRFSFQTVSGGVGYHYPILDYQADVFFSGNFQMVARVTSIYLGGFDVTITSSSRINDWSFVALGGDDLIIEFPTNISGSAATNFNDTYYTSVQSKGIFSPGYSWPMNANDNFPPGYATGAGGGTQGYGWDTPDSGRGVSLYLITGQNGDDNFACTRTDRMGGAISSAGVLNSQTPHVSSWGATSYVLSGAPSGGLIGFHFSFGGDTTITKAGNFNSPGITGIQQIDLGLDARWVKLCTQWTPSGQNPGATIRISNSVGWTEGVNQTCFWVGNADDGSQPTEAGSRILNNNCIIKTGIANAASTTFPNIAEFVNLSVDGILTIDWTVVDGSIFEVVWFAIGTAVQPEFANAGKGIYKMVTDRLNDEIYLDPQTGDSALFKIPDPNAYTAFIGDE